MGLMGEELRSKNMFIEIKKLSAECSSWNIESTLFIEGSEIWLNNRLISISSSEKIANNNNNSVPI
jgi:hypothetical protein